MLAKSPGWPSSRPRPDQRGFFDAMVSSDNGEWSSDRDVQKSNRAPGYIRSLASFHAGVRPDCPRHYRQARQARKDRSLLKDAVSRSRWSARGYLIKFSLSLSLVSSTDIAASMQRLLRADEGRASASWCRPGLSRRLSMTSRPFCPTHGARSNRRCQPR